MEQQRTLNSHCNTKERIRVEELYSLISNYITKL